MNQKVVYFLFTWANHFIFRFWFILIHFRSERIVMIHFDSLWFSILIRFDSPERNKEWPYFDFNYGIMFFLLLEFGLCFKVIDSSTCSFLTYFFLENWGVGDCSSPVALLSQEKCANVHPTLPFQTGFRWLSIHRD